MSTRDAAQTAVGMNRLIKYTEILASVRAIAKKEGRQLQALSDFRRELCAVDRQKRKGRALVPGQVNWD